MGLLIRILSYLYHLILALFLLAISLLAALSGTHNLHLAMLPWKGRELTQALLAGSLAGLLCLLLAWMGKLRFLYLLYTLAVLVMIVRGFFLSSYTFQGRAGFEWALTLTAGALLAAAGGWSQFRQKKDRW